jgi:hypothetical protein
MILALSLLLLTQAPQKQQQQDQTYHPGMAPPDGKMTDDQRCQMECSKKMRECIAPAAPRGAGDDTDQKRNEFMAKTKECMAKNQGCFSECATKKDKKGKKKEP